MIKHSIGVDPGKSGCIFIEDLRFESGVTEIKNSGAINCIYSGVFATRFNIIDNSIFVVGKEFSLFNLLSAFENFNPDTTKVTLEHVHDMPDNQGMFNFGQGYMALKCAFAAHRIPFALVEPQAWKSHHKIPSGMEKSKAKASAIKKAIASAPELEPFLTRVKDHDRAEARLIQLCGLATYQKLEGIST